MSHKDKTRRQTIKTGDGVKIISGSALLIRGRIGKVIGMTASQIKVLLPDNMILWFAPWQLEVVHTGWTEYNNRNEQNKEM